MTDTNYALGGQPRGQEDEREQQLRQQFMAQPGQQGQYQQFLAAQARKAEFDKAMQGNGSDNPFVRWLTRKPLPVKMTGYRIACGLCWAFWTFLLWAAMLFSDPGVAGGIWLFFLGALAAYYDWRIWTRRAKRLSFILIF
jgi:hypothetical protein